MAQHKVMQVVKVYARVLSLVGLFLAMTGLLYFLLPAPLDPPTTVGSPRHRPANADTAVRAAAPPSTSPLPSSEQSPATPILSNSSPVSSSLPTATAAAESCPLNKTVQPSPSPLPSRGPPRVEYYQVSVIVPVLSLNANITANLGRLFSFLNATYPRPSPAFSAPASAIAPSGSSAGHSPSSLSSPVVQASPGIRPVEVLLVVDPSRLPISTSEHTTPYPSLGLTQQWALYHLKRMIKDFQYDLRVRDETYLRLLVLSNTSRPDTTQACFASGGDSFGAACNLGAARARGQWLYFLSAETYFEEGWFEEQLQALGSTTLQSATRSTKGARPGLVGCKILDGPSTGRIHSAGYDVALSRRELQPPIASGSPAVVTPVAAPGAQTLKRSKRPVDTRTMEEWKSVIATKGTEELRALLMAMSTPQPSNSATGKILGLTSPGAAQTSADPDLVDVVFPYRRLEGVADVDGRLNEPIEITAPSSLCFITDRRTFHDVGGFRAAGREAIELQTPFLQVLDFSLRLRRDSGRRSFYLPTQRAVVLNKPGAKWNAEDDTAREDHGICSSTLLAKPAAASPSPAFNYRWATTTSGDEDNSMPLFPHSLLLTELAFEQQWHGELMRTVDARRQSEVELVWDSYGGCTGWGLEAVRFATALEPLLSKVAIIADQNSFCKGLPRNVVQGLRRMRSRLDDSRVPPSRWANDSVQVWLSHKPPVSYPTFPYKGSATVNKRPDYIIGRSMIETTAMPASWAENAKRVDEIWLPSSFLVEVFTSGGVPREKLFVLPIPIDTQFYSPLPFQSLPAAAPAAASMKAPALLPLALPNKGAFNFLSVFKWEHRKGWDVLLEAYLREFKAEDNTTLYIQTYMPGAMGRDKSTFQWKLMEVATALAAEKKSTSAPKTTAPRVEFLCEELPEQSMPRLYAAVDAFVLPTRGEGFGMPIMEAMSMGLPTIATNWSGQVDFMNESNAYPLQVEAMVEAQSAGTAAQFAGKWAQPSVQHLQQLMRHVYTHREEAQRKGRVARADIVSRFSQDKVAGLVVEQLQRIERLVRDRRKTSAT